MLFRSFQERGTGAEPRSDIEGVQPQVEIHEQIVARQMEWCSVTDELRHGGHHERQLPVHITVPAPPFGPAVADQAVFAAQLRPNRSSVLPRRCAGDEEIHVAVIARRRRSFRKQPFEFVPLTHADSLQRPSSTSSARK